MITDYLAKVESAEQGRLAAAHGGLVHPTGRSGDEDWFGRWLDLLATTCPGPVTEACHGTSLDLDILPHPRGRRNGA